MLFIEERRWTVLMFQGIIYLFVIVILHLQVYLSSFMRFSFIVNSPGNNKWPTDFKACKEVETIILILSMNFGRISLFLQVDHKTHNPRASTFLYFRF